MSKPVIVVGYKGNMGKRYTAILDYLGVDWHGIEDLGVNWDNTRKEYVSGLNTNPYHSVIIATPTHTHMKLIKMYRTLNLPILCEKPIAYEMENIEWIIKNEINLRMINQYEHISGVSGATYYDYYNTGKDEPQWDCINIIGLARQEKAYIENKSPVWKCVLNGKELKLEDVNEAYIQMIKEWVDKPVNNIEYIKTAHSRVLEGYYEKGTYRGSSEIDKQKTSGKSEHVNQRQDDDKQSAVSDDEDGSFHRRQKRKPRKRSAPASP